MRELIDRGYIYIAQAPLYKVTRGKSEQYLKDEHALEDYLTDTGLEDAVFRPLFGRRARRRRPEGAGRGGAHASATCCRACTAAITGKVVEQAAIAGVLTPSIFGDAPKALAAAAIHRARGSTRRARRPSAAGRAASRKAKVSASSAPCAA